MDKFRPLQDKVLVRRNKEKELTTGGLFIPETNREVPMEGVVIAAGEGDILENGKVRKLEVKSGDKILFNRHAGNDIKLDGEDFVIMEENEILGVIEG